MSLHALRIAQHVKIGAAMFRILLRLPDARWQLQNVATGELCTFDEGDLLDQYSRNELSFVVTVDECSRSVSRMAEKLTRDLSLCSPNLVELARIRIQYLKEIDGSSRSRSRKPPLSRLRERSRRGSMTASRLAGAPFVGTTANGWLRAATFEQSS